jgi:hypothetical protein
MAAAPAIFAPWARESAARSHKFGFPGGRASRERRLPALHHQHTHTRRPQTPGKIWFTPSIVHKFFVSGKRTKICGPGVRFCRPTPARTWGGYLFYRSQSRLENVNKRLTKKSKRIIGRSSANFRRRMIILIEAAGINKSERTSSGYYLELWTRGVLLCPRAVWFTLAHRRCDKAQWCTLRRAERAALGLCTTLSQLSHFARSPGDQSVSACFDPF